MNIESHHYNHNDNKLLPNSYQALHKKGLLIETLTLIEALVGLKDIRLSKTMGHNPD